MTEGLKITEGQYVFEAAALALIVTLAFLFPKLGRPVFRTIRRAASWSNSRPTVSAVLLAAIPMTLAAMTALILHWPEPEVHDEFAYLLAGDTFASGRMTNPPHECWRSFETIHVLPQPTRMSKYPPGQGLALAIGSLLCDTPLVGVWLSIGLFCLAVHWTLRSLVSPPIALLGWLFCVLRFAVIDYWSQSYWGGAVAATGGALVLGATVRLGRRAGFAVGVALGTGVMLLGASRPFEGLATLCALGLVGSYRISRAKGRGKSARGKAHRGNGLWSPERSNAPSREEARQFAATEASSSPLKFEDSPSATARGRRATSFPSRLAVAPLVLGATLVLVPATALFLEYNRRVTGSAFDLPYAAFDRRYAEVPPILFLEPYGKKSYPDPVIERFWTGFCTRDYHAQRTLGGFIRGAWKKTIVEWRYLLGVFGTAAFAAAFFTRATRRRLTLPFAAAAGNGLAVLAETYHLVHYAAPAAASWIAMQAIGLAGLIAWRPKKRTVGLTVAVWLLIAQFVLVLLAAQRWAEPHTGFGERRAKIVRYLESEPGKDLVIVYYAPTHDSHYEWVYNDADLESASVLFARSLDADANRRLLTAFPDRRVWRLDVNEPRLAAELRPVER